MASVEGYLEADTGLRAFSIDGELILEYGDLSLWGCVIWAFEGVSEEFKLSLA
jgi:hypothetical protein